MTDGDDAEGSPAVVDRQAIRKTWKILVGPRPESGAGGAFQDASGVGAIYASNCELIWVLRTREVERNADEP